MTEKFFFGFGAERFAAFMVNTDDLLVASDDASFYRGDALGVGEDAFVDDVGGAETFLQGAAGFVGADGAEDFHARAEGGEIGRHVAGAAEAFALLGEIDDGDGGLGREARGGAPKVTVEHEVAEDADAFAAQAREQAFEACGGIVCWSAHAWIIRVRWWLLLGA